MSDEHFTPEAVTESLRIDEPGVRSQQCPSCSVEVTMVPYDIGSGPEMSCGHCEWCWGADGQALKPLVLSVLDRRLVYDMMRGEIVASVRLDGETQSTVEDS